MIKIEKKFQKKGLLTIVFVFLCMSCGINSNAMSLACPDALSPISGSIVFVSRSNLFSIREDGTGVTQLTALPENLIAREPAWSPNGEILAFTLTRADTGVDQHEKLSSATSVICGLNRQTSKGYLLVQGSEKDESISSSTWASDSNALIVTVYHADKPSTIARYDINTNKLQTIIAGATATTMMNFPVVSIDGEELAYIQIAVSPPNTLLRLPPKTTQTLMLARINGQSAHPVMIDQPAFGLLTEPRWSPDNRQLIFVGNPSGTTLAAPGEITLIDRLLGVSVVEAHEIPASIWIVGHDGKGLHEIVKGLDAPSITWSPDARYIAYTGGLKGGVFLFDIASGQVQQLTVQGDYGGITWAKQ